MFIDDINIFGISTGVNNPFASDEAISIYPNPAQDHLNVTLNLSKNSEVEVVLKDVTGKTVMKKKNKLLQGDTKLQLGTTDLSSGLYFIQIKSDGILISTKKIIISK